MRSSKHNASNIEKLESLEHEAQRKIGRNVINFQRIEAMIKFLVSRSHIEGTMNDLKRIVTKKEQDVQKRSLGLLANDLFLSVLSDNPPNAQNNDTELPWISFSFKSEMDDVTRIKLKSELKDLIESRNQLIHHRLKSIGSGSEENWQELVEYLDKQHEQLIPIFDWLQSLGKSFIKIANELQASNLNDPPD